MHEQSPPRITPAEYAARLNRVEAMARSLGFVGTIEYRHAYGRSGGAQYFMAESVESDVLAVDAEAFRRDAAGDDFSLAAIIAHERGHQLVFRHARVRRNIPQGMSAVTEEILASLVGAVIAPVPNDGQMLVMKALGDLVERGMSLAEASRHVEHVLRHLEALL